MTKELLSQVLDLILKGESPRSVAPPTVRLLVQLVNVATAPTSAIGARSTATTATTGTSTGTGADAGSGASTSVGAGLTLPTSSAAASAAGGAPPAATTLSNDARAAPLRVPAAATPPAPSTWPSTSPAAAAAAAVPGRWEAAAAAATAPGRREAAAATAHAASARAAPAPLMAAPAGTAARAPARAAVPDGAAAAVAAAQRALRHSAATAVGFGGGLTCGTAGGTHITTAHEDHGSEFVGDDGNSNDGSDVESVASDDSDCDTGGDSDTGGVLQDEGGGDVSDDDTGEDGGRPPRAYPWHQERYSEQRAALKSLREDFAALFAHYNTNARLQHSGNVIEIPAWLLLRKVLTLPVVKVDGTIPKMWHEAMPDSASNHMIIWCSKTIRAALHASTVWFCQAADKSGLSSRQFQNVRNVVTRVLGVLSIHNTMAGKNALSEKNKERTAVAGSWNPMQSTMRFLASDNFAVEAHDRFEDAPCPADLLQVVPAIPADHGVDQMRPAATPGSPTASPGATHVSSAAGVPPSAGTAQSSSRVRRHPAHRAKHKEWSARIQDIINACKLTLDPLSCTMDVEAGMADPTGHEQMLSFSMVRVLQIILPKWFELHPSAFADNVVHVKVTFDGRAFTGRKHAFTTLGMSILNPGVASQWQVDSNFYPIVEWNGNDSAAMLNKCHDVRAAIMYLRKQHLLVKSQNGEERKVVVRFWLGADMKAMWAWFGCGGVHDSNKHFCHRCHCHADHRHTLFELYKVKWDDSLETIAAHHHITTAKLVEINTGQGRTHTPVLDKGQGETQMPGRGCKNEEEVYAAYTAYSSSSTSRVFPGSSHWQARAATCNFTKVVKHANSPDQTFKRDCGWLVRVPVVWGMDRHCDRNFVHFDHIDCPPCMEHAPTRIFEHFMEAILFCARQAGRLPALERNLLVAGLGWVPRRDPESGKLKAVKFGCHSVGRNMVAAVAECVDGEHWLKGVLPDPLYTAAVQQLRLLNTITKVGRLFTPSAHEQMQFAHACKELHWSIVMTWPPKYTRSLYLHCLSAHGAEYMLTLQSLARFMQSNCEKNQKIANNSMQHSTFGGGWGKEAVLRSGEVVRIQQSAIATVMERRNRRYMDEYLPMCDTAWLKANTQADQVDAMWKGMVVRGEWGVAAGAVGGGGAHAAPPPSGAATSGAAHAPRATSAAAGAGAPGAGGPAAAGADAAGAAGVEGAVDAAGAGRGARRGTTRAARHTARAAGVGDPAGAAHTTSAGPAAAGAAARRPTGNARPAAQRAAAAAAAAAGIVPASGRGRDARPASPTPSLPAPGVDDDIHQRPGGHVRPRRQRPGMTPTKQTPNDRKKKKSRFYDDSATDSDGSA